MSKCVSLHHFCVKAIVKVRKKACERILTFPTEPLEIWGGWEIPVCINIHQFDLYCNIYLRVGRKKMGLSMKLNGVAVELLGVQMLCLGKIKAIKCLL